MQSLFYYRFRSRDLMQVILSLFVAGVLFSACSLPGSSNGGSAGQASAPPVGVTPMSTNSPRVVAQIPASIGRLPAGIPLPGNEQKPLTFNLLYNDAAMENAVAQMYTPGSSTYRQFLTPDQIVQRYAESDTQLNAVESWLKQNGYTILSIDPLRSQIQVQSSVAQIEQSLHIQWQQFTVSGHSFFMQVGSPTLSGEVAGLVQSIVGLDNFALPLFQPPFSTLQGGSSTTAQVNCQGYGKNLSLTSARLASAYQFNSLYQQGFSGRGMTIGVAEFDEPYSLQAVNTYTACANGSPSHIQNIQVDGPTASGAGEGEATLDLDLISGLAPQAQVLDYQVGTNNNAIPFAQALLDLFNRVAVDHRVQVLSVSYGTGEGEFSQSEQDAVNRALRNLAAEGISVFISSGDCAAFSNRVPNIAAVSFPASAPYAIAVGGTHLQVNANNTRSSETAWGNNDGALLCQNEWGSGGGVSQNTDFKRPSWQTGNGINSQYNGLTNDVFTANLTPVQAPNGLRQVPDLAAAAFPNIAIYYQGTWYAFGGTSAAAPIWAAGALLVDEGLIHAGKPLLGGVPTFYALANHPASFRPYTDITQGNNLFYTATSGWDYTTGWGSPNLNDVLHLAATL
jgi:kumamolisin